MDSMFVLVFLFHKVDETIHHENLLIIDIYDKYLFEINNNQHMGIHK